MIYYAYRYSRACVDMAMHRKWQTETIYNSGSSFVFISLISLAFPIFLCIGYSIIYA